MPETQKTDVPTDILLQQHVHMTEMTKHPQKNNIFYIMGLFFYFTVIQISQMCISQCFAVIYNYTETFFFLYIKQCSSMCQYQCRSLKPSRMDMQASLYNISFYFSMDTEIIYDTKKQLDSMSGVFAFLIVLDVFMMV